MKTAQKLSDHQCQIILTLADADMCVSKAARNYYMSEPGYVYQLKRIKDITGKDPKKFYDLCDLLLYIKAEWNRKHIEATEQAFKNGYDAAKAELVNCEQCKHYKQSTIRNYYGWCNMWGSTVRGNGYCHNGERANGAKT